MSTASSAPSFSDAEYQRRWQAVAGKIQDYNVDAMAVTGRLNVPYLAGYDDDGMWPSPVIIAANVRPTFVARDYDADTIRLESRIPNLVTFFGDDDHTDVWAETLRDLGLGRARLGLDLGTYGVAPADLMALQQRLPDLTIVDATDLISTVTAVKSVEEIAVMRRAMELTRVGIATFNASLSEGADELAAYERVSAAMQAAGSEADRAFTLLFGQRTARPHSAPAHYTLRAGDVAFTELGGRCRDYFAGLCRTAVLGRNPAAEQLYSVAREAQEAALAAVRPGITTGDIDRACRSVVQRAGRSDTFRHRTGYAIGLGWQARGNISIHPGGTHLVEEGMTFHMPTILFQQGEFGVGVSETVVVTADGCEPLSGLSRDLVLV